VVVVKQHFYQTETTAYKKSAKNNLRYQLSYAVALRRLSGPDHSKSEHALFSAGFDFRMGPFQVPTRFRLLCLR